MRMASFLVLACCGIVLITNPLPSAPPDPADRDATILRDAGLATDDNALLDFFRQRTLRDQDRDKIQTLIKQLGDDSFQVREEATSALIALGPAAEAQLKQAAESFDPEVKQRAGFCLSKLAKASSSSVVQAAARLLAAHKPNGAVEALFQFLPFAADESTADTVRSGLAKAGVKDGKPDKLLLDGLEDKVPAKRLGAALALYRAGVPDLKPTLMKLLKDPELSIRFRFALMLVESKERDAVPALIDMIPDVQAGQLRQIEDLLGRIAQDKGPKPEGSGEPKRIRDAWSSWWKENGEKIDFAKLDLTPKLLGHMLIVERTTTPRLTSRVYEIDKDGKTLWEITGLRYAIDAKIVAEDRVLIAESTSRLVTERNFKGEVQWQYQSPTPVQTVQRLPGGNTLVVCRNSIIEVDKDGKAVSSHDIPTGNCYIGGKTKDGNLGILSATGQYTLVNPEGKELKSFQVERPSLYGGEVLPDGGLIVASTIAGKVLEYSPDGKVVWEATVQAPMSISRMPNGNFLVASATGLTITELDRTGKEVSKHSCEGRPYRAYGR